jgi:hypothetical protein
VLCGFGTRYNPRMASAPERHQVLSRLGIVKGSNDDLFPSAVNTRAEFDQASIDGALESFPAESGIASAIRQALKTVSSRNALLLLIAVSVVCVVAVLFAFRTTADSEKTPSPSTSPGASELSPVAADSASAATTSKAVSPTRAASIAGRTKSPIQARSASPARQPIATKPAEKVSSEVARFQEDQRLDTRKPLSSETTAAAPLPLTDEVARVIDSTVYSKNDEDVRPPRLLSEQLPTPTIGGWITRTNVIEVIVSETGAVEHARFVSTPQRMPDTFILSRAKVWKFSPAMKDGRPVRYRLLLSWEVNP